jgi:predicted ATP-grasp superfamily ATP-dependent carboligase
MDPLVWQRRPTLERPAIVAAFRGWNDAGRAASGAVEHLREAWGAEAFASIDPEEFFDFQATRPEVRLVEGETRQIDWPANEILHAKPDGRDVVLLDGVEPNTRWRTFTATIGGLARDLGAERFLSLGAFLADVPHRSPVPLIGSLADPVERDRLGLLPSNYEGPTGITGVVSAALTSNGLRSESLWAAVPHYAPNDDPKAAMALARTAARVLGVSADVSELLPAADEWEREVDEVVAGNDTLTQYVSELEEAEASEAPTGEEIAAEVERFLRDQRGGKDQP